MPRAEIVVDLDAVRENVAALRRRVRRPLMAVVKADGYGHGMLPCARAALDGGADMLGVAVIDEALQLRRAGIHAPVLAWLATPGEDFATALRHDVELSVGATWALDEVVAAAVEAGVTARVHLKADTGLSRGGAVTADWPDLVDAAARAQADGSIEIVSVWSHLANSELIGHPSIGAQLRALLDAAELAKARGLDAILHLANSGATLTAPDTWLDMVRPGLACYGLDPTEGDPARFGLRPAMTTRAEIALVKRVPAGVGVSYGHRYVTDRETTLALVPVGYAEGVPRAATNTCEVWVAGARRPIRGTVCMDQFVVQVDDGQVRPGDEVVLWGPGDRGEPTVQEWATRLGTINYELVTRIGGRMSRRYVGADGAADG
jgi:alanine racemase